MVFFLFALLYLFRCLTICLIILFVRCFLIRRLILVQDLNSYDLHSNSVELNDNLSFQWTFASFFQTGHRVQFARNNEQKKKCLHTLNKKTRLLSAASHWQTSLFFTKWTGDQSSVVRTARIVCVYVCKRILNADKK